jgi:hypothetical protein
LLLLLVRAGLEGPWLLLMVQLLGLVSLLQQCQQPCAAHAAAAAAVVCPPGWRTRCELLSQWVSHHCCYWLLALLDLQLRLQESVLEQRNP